MREVSSAATDFNSCCGVFEVSSGWLRRVTLGCLPSSFRSAVVPSFPVTGFVSVRCSFARYSDWAFPISGSEFVFVAGDSLNPLATTFRSLPASAGVDRWRTSPVSPSPSWPLNFEVNSLLDFSVALYVSLPPWHARGWRSHWMIGMHLDCFSSSVMNPSY